MTLATTKPTNLQQLRQAGWVSRPVKREIYDNFMRMLGAGEELFPGIIGFDDTVIPEINLGLISGHDLRGYIDPNFEIDREDVRHVELPTQHLPVCLALHPTLPIAYLGCQSRERAGPSQIDVVRMRIPGVEHPADQ